MSSFQMSHAHYTSSWHIVCLIHPFVTCWLFNHWTATCNHHCVSCHKLLWMFQLVRDVNRVALFTINLTLLWQNSCKWNWLHFLKQFFFHTNYDHSVKCWRLVCWQCCFWLSSVSLFHLLKKKQLLVLLIALT